MLVAATITAGLASGAPDAALRTGSDVTGASLVPLAALPRSPEHGALPEFCASYRAAPGTLTAAGRAVAQLGWIVTSEAALGHYRAVSFASGFEPGTSGICTPRNANIGLFDGTQLVALAYTARSEDWQLGKLSPIETGGLLVEEGQGVGSPVAELHERDGGLRLTGLAASYTYCNGRAVVPNLANKSIAVARKLLLAQGWQPVRPAEAPDPDDVASRLAKRGLIEADSCSGTGVGYCRFNYRNAAGRLAVITVGGDPDPANDQVVDASVTCNTNPAKH